MSSVYADESLSEVGATNDSPCETILACPFLKKQNNNNNNSSNHRTMNRATSYLEETSGHRIKCCN